MWGYSALPGMAMIFTAHTIKAKWRRCRKNLQVTIPFLITITLLKWLVFCCFGPVRWVVSKSYRSFFLKRDSNSLNCTLVVLKVILLMSLYHLYAFGGCCLAGIWELHLMEQCFSVHSLHQHHLVCLLTCRSSPSFQTYWQHLWGKGRRIWMGTQMPLV